MTVPFLDLSAAYAELKSEIDAAVLRVLASGYYVLGPEVEAFEQEFADYCEALHAVSVGNGLDALILALRALDIGSGDEVLVPSNTYIATWLAVSAVGAVPKAVEPDPATGNIDPNLVEAAVTDRTRAVIAVHLYGQSADLDPLLDVARRRGLFLVEDAAQAHGARYKGRRIGAHGDVVCWSFYPSKNLGALGDGGAVTTNNPDVADRVALYRNYGSRKKYFHEVKGVNSRLDPVQAAVLRVKLRHLDNWNGRRRAVAQAYMESIVHPGLTLPHVPNWAEPVWHLFVIQADDRDRTQSHLAEAGIQTQIHYPIPPHMQGVYKGSGHLNADNPVANRLASRVLSLPIGPHLLTGDQDRVIATLRNAAT